MGSPNMMILYHMDIKEQGFNKRAKCIKFKNSRRFPQHLLTNPTQASTVSFQDTNDKNKKLTVESPIQPLTITI